MKALKAILIKEQNIRPILFKRLKKTKSNIINSYIKNLNRLYNSKYRKKLNQSISSAKESQIPN